MPPKSESNSDQWGELVRKVDAGSEGVVVG